MTDKNTRYPQIKVSHTLEYKDGMIVKNDYTISFVRGEYSNQYLYGLDKEGLLLLRDEIDKKLSKDNCCNQ